MDYSKTSYNPEVIGGIDYRLYTIYMLYNIYIYIRIINNMKKVSIVIYYYINFLWWPKSGGILI